MLLDVFCKGLSTNRIHKLCKAVFLVTKNKANWVHCYREVPLDTRIRLIHNFSPVSSWNNNMFLMFGKLVSLITKREFPNPNEPWKTSAMLCDSEPCHVNALSFCHSHTFRRSLWLLWWGKTRPTYKTGDIGGTVIRFQL